MYLLNLTNLVQHLWSLLGSNSCIRHPSDCCLNGACELSIEGGSTGGRSERGGHSFSGGVVIELLRHD